MPLKRKNGYVFSQCDPVCFFEACEHAPRPVDGGDGHRYKLGGKHYFPGHRAGITWSDVTKRVRPKERGRSVLVLQDWTEYTGQPVLSSRNKLSAVSKFSGYALGKSSAVFVFLEDHVSCRRHVDQIVRFERKLTSVVIFARSRGEGYINIDSAL